MQKRKPRKMRVSVTKNRNMVLYVEDSTMKAKVFTSAEKAVNFAKTFKKNNPDPMAGYWVDMLVTDIKGDIKSLDGMEIVNGS